MAVSFFTPTGYATVAAPPDLPSDPTGNSLPYVPISNAIPLPTGTTPAAVSVENIGPETAYFLIAAAAASPTGTAAAGATVITVSVGTGIATGQQVLGAGIATGTFVVAVNGTSVTLSRPTTLALSGTQLNFVTPVTYSTGIAVQPNTSPQYVAYVTNGFISVISTSLRPAIVNVAVGT